MTHPQQDNPKGTKMRDKIDIDELIRKLENKRVNLTSAFQRLNGKISPNYNVALLDISKAEDGLSEAIAALTDMKAREDVVDYLKISDSDAALIRGLLDVTDIWDNHDKAIDRMLSCFPNDPLNKTNHKGDEL